MFKSIYKHDETEFILLLFYLHMFGKKHNRYLILKHTLKHGFYKHKRVLASFYSVKASDKCRFFLLRTLLNGALYICSYQLCDLSIE